MWWSFLTSAQKQINLEKYIEINSYKEKELGTSGNFFSLWKCALSFFSRLGFFILIRFFPHL